MSNIILQENAAPLYDFLSLLESKRAKGELVEEPGILDCGAGGSVPPLAAFSQLGYGSYGIDISRERLDLARKYCAEKGIEVDLRQADMRQIPFEDGFFDCVYEFYSICHLSHQDTAKAISEMHRVTKEGGYCFLGLISRDTWPASIFGEEREPGEFWGQEAGKEQLHSMFSDREGDLLMADWEILSKVKRVMYLRKTAREMSEDEWMELIPAGEYSREDWRKEYPQRENWRTYAHTFYTLRK